MFFVRSVQTIDKFCEIFVTAVQRNLNFNISTGPSHCLAVHFQSLSSCTNVSMAHIIVQTLQRTPMICLILATDQIIQDYVGVQHLWVLHSLQD